MDASPEAAPADAIRNDNGEDEDPTEEFADAESGEPSRMLSELELEDGGAASEDGGGLSPVDSSKVLDVGAMSVTEIEAHDLRSCEAVELFFNSKFVEAEDLLSEFSNSDALYAFGKAMFATMKATATSAAEDIDCAISLLNKAIAIADAQHKLSGAKSGESRSASSSSSNLAAASSSASPTAPETTAEDASQSSPLSSAWSLKRILFMSSSRKQSLQNGSPSSTSSSGSSKSSNNSVNGDGMSSSNGGGGGGGLFFGKGKTQSTILNPGQLRSTVCRAESTLVLSMLHMMSESIAGLVRSGLALRRGYRNIERSYNDYKRFIETCAVGGGSGSTAAGEQTEKTKELISRYLDKNTRGGILFGFGSINVSLSLLPTRFLKLISFFGFKHDRDLGYDLIEECVRLDNMRSPLASFFIAGMNTVLLSFSPLILGPSMAHPGVKYNDIGRYPRSPSHLMMLARLLRSVRSEPTSTALYTYAKGVQTNWREFQLVCDYELGVNAMVRRQWREAAEIFARLRHSKYWSTAFFAYAEWCCRSAAGEERWQNASQTAGGGGGGNNNEDGRPEQTLEELRKLAPTLVVRKYGGRTLPVEAYIQHRAQRGFYHKGAGRLAATLPVLELLLIWNAYSYMPMQELLMTQMELQGADTGPRSDTKESGVSQAVRNCVQAAVCLNLGQHREAVQALESLFGRERELLASGETWLIAYGRYLHGVLALLMGSSLHEGARDAMQHFKTASKYSGYIFEFNVAFRIHVASLSMRRWADDTSYQAVNPRATQIMPTVEELVPSDHALWTMIDRAGAV